MMDTSNDDVNWFKITFQQYLLHNHVSDLKKLLELQDTEKHCYIIVHFFVLVQTDRNLYNGILSNATRFMPLLDECLLNAQRKILSHEMETSENMSVKTNAHIRIMGFPDVGHRFNFPMNRDTGRVLRFSGTVIRRTKANIVEYRRDFKCNPEKCCNVDCDGRSFLPVAGIDQSNCKNYQEIKIQERVDKISKNLVPKFIWATLEDDLVDSCQPGDNVELHGAVMYRWKPLKIGVRTEAKLFFRVSHLIVSNRRDEILITDEMKKEFQAYWEEAEDVLVARNEIIASICPKHYGMYVVKLAMAVTLAGGVAKMDANGCRMRGDPHLLLVGDPGTGKSELMRFAAKIYPRSVHTIGAGVSSAGLTASAVQEHGQWHLEAGALVLADGGLCCIDEFNCMKKEDKTAIHEAMEQQTISVAKAGITCKLNTRCSIVAAMNPKKGFIDEDVENFLGIGNPLLSRFDLVLLLKDSRNEQWDQLLASFAVHGVNDVAEENCERSSSLWSEDKLQKYFCLVKNLRPTLSADANAVLTRYYKGCRRDVERDAARTTVRLQESLIRLSQGHAKIMFRSEVTVQDAIVAIMLMESSMCDSAFVDNSHILNQAFPKNPEDDYDKICRSILEKLDLREIWQRETRRRDNNSTAARSSFHENTPPRPPPVSNSGSQEEMVGKCVEESERDDDDDISEIILRIVGREKGRDGNKRKIITRGDDDDNGDGLRRELKIPCLSPKTEEATRENTKCSGGSSKVLRTSTKLKLAAFAAKDKGKEEEEVAEMIANEKESIDVSLDSGNGTATQSHLDIHQSSQFPSAFFAAANLDDAAGFFDDV